MANNPDFNRLLAEGLAQLKPTNRDRLRAMSDEELAYLLVHNPWMREESALNWLQSPVGGTE